MSEFIRARGLNRGGPRDIIKRYQPAEEHLKKLPAAIAYSIFCTGLALLLLSIVSEVGWQPNKVLIDFIRELGLLLSASMAGTLLYEMFVREQMTKQMIAELSIISEKTAREFRSGFRLVHNNRRGYNG